MSHDAHISTSTVREWTPRSFWCAAIVMICATMAATTYPVFRLPQLDPDDYRYLNLVQQLDDSPLEALRAATIVENRWDHLWWMRTPERVAFFRPMVIASYWVDAKLWGQRIVVGLLISNLVIYLALCVLATAVIVGWFGRTWPVLLAAGLFAAHPSHSELIWYIAGRTDSIAGVAFLAALAIYQRRARMRAARWACPVLYAVALLTKEWAACLPVVCFLHDWLLAGPRGSIVTTLRRNVAAYCGFAAAGVLVVALRLVVMHGQESALVYPYFVSPLRADFVAHLWLQLRSYGENLLIGSISPALVSIEIIRMYVSTTGLAITIPALVAAAVLAAKDRRAAVMLLMAIAAWLPVSVVYLSERYLLLPSLAMAGCMVALLELIRHRNVRLVAGLAVVLWGAWLGRALIARHEFVARARPAHLTTQKLVEQRERLAKADAIFIANLPGSWIDAQFAAEQVRWVLGNADLRVCVLNTVSPIVARSLQPDVAWSEGGEVVLRSYTGVIRRVAITADAMNAFEGEPFRSGETIDVPTVGVEVQIEGVEGGEVIAATVRDKAGAKSPVLIDFSRPDPIVVKP